MSDLVLCIATMNSPADDVPDTVESLFRMSTTKPGYHFICNTPENNLGVVGSYQQCYEKTSEPILAFIHDDVLIREQGWDARILKEFEDPQVGIVGFGGAKRHGSNELYKMPYHLPHLGRSDYLSNVDDAEVHGLRFTGETDVAVLDGFCLIVRRSTLDRFGGWRPLVGHIDFFCYDYALCALGRRYGYRTRLVGVRCHHYGGRTSVGDGAKKLTSQEAYDKSHRWFYENFRDVMPAEAK